MSRKFQYGLILTAAVAGGFFLLKNVLGNAMFPFFLCALVWLAGLTALENLFPQAPAQPQKAPLPAPVPQAPPAMPEDDLLAAQRTFARIQALFPAVGTPAIQKEGAECVQLCGEILEAAREDPAARKNLDNFFRHYLPMFEEVMDHYVKCEAAGVLSEEKAAQFTAFLDVMENAMKKLKEKVYAHEVDRLSINIDVLENLYQADGLVDDGLLGQPEKKRQ